MTVDALIADLRDEQEALDPVVAPLTDEEWVTPTPSTGWTVAHQIAHLTYFDGTGTTAIVDPEQFASTNEELFARLADGTSMDESSRTGQRPTRAEATAVRAYPTYVTQRAR